MADDNKSSSVEMISSVVGIATESFSGLNAAINVVKGIKDLIKNDAAGSNREAREKLIDLTDQLLSVREQNAALREALLDMKKIISERNDFEAKVNDYVLKEVATNSFAYELKTPIDQQAAPVRFCANCFSNEKLSLLQFARADYNTDVIACAHCGAEIHVSADRNSTIMSLPRADRDLW
jgi:uncharacterized protein YeeX (DUF496 family)